MKDRLFKNHILFLSLKIINFLQTMKFCFTYRLKLYFCPYFLKSRNLKMLLLYIYCIFSLYRYIILCVGLFPVPGGELRAHQHEQDGGGVYAGYNTQNRIHESSSSSLLWWSSVLEPVQSWPIPVHEAGSGLRLWKKQIFYSNLNKKLCFEKQSEIIFINHSFKNG